MIESNQIAVMAVPATGPIGRAEILARELALPLIEDSTRTDFAWLLALTPQRLELRQQGPQTPGPIYVDFADGALAHRRRFGGGRGQPLARAVGLKGGNSRIMDATAGLGQDAFVLACLGCRVHMVERSPIIAALLRDGLERAALDPEIGPLVKERLRLTVAESGPFMEQLKEEARPEVVYLDPMYPHRAKAALVKKEMRALRQIVGEDRDASGLLAAALGCARRRVVVKRPRLAPILKGPEPNARIEAPNTRFDIYSILANPGSNMGP